LRLLPPRSRRTRGDRTGARSIPTRRLGAGALALVAAATLAACGGGSVNPATTTVVDTVQGSQYGPVLTTSAGQTLYMFPPDAERHVTCTKLCAASWPPLTVKDGHAPKAGKGVQQSLLGTDPDPTGGPAVVTYDGWPLYTYTDDTKAGQTNGEGIYLDGGYWWVIAPSGQPITT
jgi:predicted lipoprotein with Yx(FWY)xxD motif